jgi:hypothetical protein
MGTSNFYNVNAKRVYAILMGYDRPVLDDEGEETSETEYSHPDEWESDDFIADIKFCAREFADKNAITYYQFCDEDPHELRSYASAQLFQFYTHKKYGDVTITICINCVARIGYYEGANLDWYVTYDLGNGVNADIDFQSDFYYLSDMPTGMKEIQYKNAEIWAYYETDRLIDLTEQFFEETSTPLIVTARFSNGETCYAKAN